MIPKFCHVCAGPFPWAKREALFYSLLDMLNDEDINPADSLKVRDAPSTPSATIPTHPRRFRSSGGGR